MLYNQAAHHPLRVGAASRETTAEIHTPTRSACAIPLAAALLGASMEKWRQQEAGCVLQDKVFLEMEH